MTKNSTKKMANNKNANGSAADSIGQKFLEDFEKRYNDLAKGTRRKAIDVNAVRNVGNNGYNLGQQFTLTGAIEVVDILDPNDNKTVTGCYLGLPTVEGPKLSLAALMGVSTLRGYILDGTIKDSHDNEFTAETTADAKKPTFKCWDLKDRNIYALAKKIREDSAWLQNKKVTFHGIALRTITRRQDTTDFNDVEWKAGEKSVIQQRLWSVAV
jgi:hypothetical protein